VRRLSPRDIELVIKRGRRVGGEGEKEKFRRLIKEALEGCDITVEEWVRAVREARMEH
jgi:hypothetical protein